MLIHDIAPEERQDTVNALCRKLKGNGMIFIRELIKKSHGIPVMEIRTLFTKAGFREAEHRETKSEYKGRFQSA